MPNYYNCTLLDVGFPNGKLVTLEVTDNNDFILHGKDQYGRAEVIAKWAGGDVAAIDQRIGLESSTDSIEIFFSNTSSLGGRSFNLNFFNKADLLNEEQRETGARSQIDQGSYIESLTSFCDNEGRLQKFHHEVERAKVVRDEIVSIMTSSNPQIENSIDFKQRNEILKHYRKRWETHQISNFEYLLKINSLAGRSLNDPNCYPFFPIVLDQYSKSLDLTNFGNYRDLRKPIGIVNQSTQYVNGIQDRQDRHDPRSDPKLDFQLGTFVSHGGVALHLLIRQQPFTSEHVIFQTDFDLAERLYGAIADGAIAAEDESMSQSISHDKVNLKSKIEYTPEFYYFPDFLVNSDKRDFGELQKGRGKVDDVILPVWAENEQDMIRQLKNALESSWVTAMLPYWIDLHFGTDIGNTEKINLYPYVAHVLPETLFFETTTNNRFAKQDLNSNLTSSFSYGRVPLRLFNESQVDYMINKHGREYGELPQIYDEIKELEKKKENSQDQTMLEQIDKGLFACKQRANQILNNMQVDHLSFQENTILHEMIAYHNDDEEIEQHLGRGEGDINALNWQGKTALHLAIENKRYHLAYVLILRGANPNIVDRQGNTILHLLAKSARSMMGDNLDHTAQFNEISNFRHELLNQGIMPNSSINRSQKTPLQEFVGYVAPLPFKDPIKLKNDKLRPNANFSGLLLDLAMNDEYFEIAKSMFSEEEIVSAFFLSPDIRADTLNGFLDLISRKKDGIFNTIMPLHLLCQNPNISPKLLQIIRRYDLEGNMLLERNQQGISALDLLLYNAKTEFLSGASTSLLTLCSCLFDNSENVRRQAKKDISSLKKQMSKLHKHDNIQVEKIRFVANILSIYNGVEKMCKKLEKLYSDGVKGISSIMQATLINLSALPYIANIDKRSEKNNKMMLKFVYSTIGKQVDFLLQSIGSRDGKEIKDIYFNILKEAFGAKNNDINDYLSSFKKNHRRGFGERTDDQKNLELFKDEQPSLRDEQDHKTPRDDNTMSRLEGFKKDIQENKEKSLKK